ncbi:MAG: alcohol dehydrogenase catalytic domain-containing protein [Acidimicrobiia bacterium]
MRAAVYRRRGVLEIDTIPVPDPGPDEVLVSVEHCGVCGTDLHAVLDGWGIPDTIGGHEYTGTVVAVGSAVNGWAPGDPAVGGPTAPCGECDFCHDGRTSLCENRAPMGETEFQGAFAEFVVARAAELLHPPDGLPLRHAALAEPLAVALHALDRAPTDPAARVLVSGVGPIGALIIAVLAARGVSDIVASEPSPARRDLAARLGASVCEPDDFSTPASPSRVVDDAFDVAFECSGKAPAVEACLGQLGTTGTLVIVGAGLDVPSLDPNRILLNELVVTGSCASGPPDFEAALELMASGCLPLDDLVESADVPLDRMLDALKDLQAGTIPGKVLITP